MNLKYIKLITVFIIFLTASKVFAQDNITVIVNEKTVNFENQAPVIVDNRTLVPLRGIFDAMGYEIYWDNLSKSAVLEKNDTKIVATANDNYLVINDEIIQTDVAPKIINNSLMIPLRAIADLTDASVNWNQETKTISVIYKSDEEKVLNLPPEGNMTNEEIEYLNNALTKTANIKHLANQLDENIFAKFYTFPDYDETKDIYIEDIDYSKITETIDELNELQPPESLSKIHTDIIKYTDIVKSIINMNERIKKGKISKTDNNTIANLIDSYINKRTEISVQFNIDLYEFFKNNNVLYEKLYGSDVSDIM